MSEVDIKVSIIGVFCNNAKYAQACLNSLVHQTLQEIEIICVYDASEDNTLEILEQTQKEFPQIRIVQAFEHLGEIRQLVKDNMNPYCAEELEQNLKITNKDGIPKMKLGINRNLGLFLAKGEYVCFVDGDDIADRNMAYLLYEKAKENQAKVVMSLSNIFWNNNPGETQDYMPLDTAQKSIQDILLRYFGSHGKLYKRDFLMEQSIYFSVYIPEDSLFNTIIAYHCSDGIVFYPVVTHYYRVHSQGWVTQPSIDKIFCYIFAIEKTMFLLSLRPEFQGKRERSLYIFSILVTDIVRLSLRSDIYFSRCSLKECLALFLDLSWEFHARGWWEMIKKYGFFGEECLQEFYYMSPWDIFCKYSQNHKSFSNLFLKLFFQTIYLGFKFCFMLKKLPGHMKKHLGSIIKPQSELSSQRRQRSSIPKKLGLLNPYLQKMWKRHINLLGKDQTQAECIQQSAKNQRIFDQCVHQIDHHYNKKNRNKKMLSKIIKKLWYIPKQKRRDALY